MIQQNRKAILGLVLVLVGAFFLLNNLGVLPRLPWWAYEWYSILIGIGIVVTAAGNRSTGIVLMGIGAAFLIQDIYYFRWRDFWPVILIVIGLSFIFRHKKSASNQTFDDNYFEALNIFGGGNQRVVSSQLEGGKTTTIFGGTEIDLRESKPVDGAVIEIFTAFGGVEFLVPADWKIKNESHVILGGFEDKRQTEITDNSPQVIVRGTVIFGGGELKS